MALLKEVEARNPYAAGYGQMTKIWELITQNFRTYLLTQRPDYDEKYDMNFNVNRIRVRVWLYSSLVASITSFV